MRDDDRLELTSWKEISQRLQVSVRTAQLWEKERGLPVRRVPGKRGRVYMRLTDLERWLDSADLGADGQRDLRPRTGRGGRGQVGAGAGPPGRLDARRQAGWVPAAGVVAVLVGLALWTGVQLSSPTRQPARWAVSATELIVSDDNGRELWRVAFDEGLQDRNYANPQFEPLLTDLDGDGSVEVVFTQYHRSGARRSVVYCFSADGQELWRRIPGRRMATANEAFDDVYSVSFVTTVPRSDGTLGVAIAAHHHIYYPNVIELLASDGTLVSEYWHPGHLAQTVHRLLALDLDGDGAAELLATGVNNARDLATLVVLDPERMTGAAAEANPSYSFRDLPPAPEIARVFFPRSALIPVTDRFNVAGNIVPGADGVTVGVHESTSDPGAVVMYGLTPELRLLKVSPSDAFIASYRLLERDGQAPHPLAKEVELLDQIIVERAHPPAESSVTHPSGATGDRPGVGGERPWLGFPKGPGPARPPNG